MFFVVHCRARPGGFVRLRERDGVCMMGIYVCNKHMMEYKLASEDTDLIESVHATLINDIDGCCEICLEFGDSSVKSLQWTGLIRRPLGDPKAASILEQLEVLKTKNEI